MYDAVAGTFLVVGLGEEDFASLTPELAQKYEQLFHQPEAFLKLGNRLLVLPVPDEPPTEKPRTKPPESMTAKITLLHGRLTIKSQAPKCKNPPTDRCP